MALESLRSGEPRGLQTNAVSLDGKTIAPKSRVWAAEGHEVEPVTRYLARRLAEYRRFAPEGEWQQVPDEPARP